MPTKVTPKPSTPAKVKPKTPPATKNAKPTPTPSDKAKVLHDKIPMDRDEAERSQIRLEKRIN